MATVIATILAGMASGSMRNLGVSNAGPVRRSLLAAQYIGENENLAKRETLRTYHTLSNRQAHCTLTSHCALLESKQSILQALRLGRRRQLLMRRFDICGTFRMQSFARSYDVLRGSIGRSPRYPKLSRHILQNTTTLGKGTHA